VKGEFVAIRENPEQKGRGWDGTGGRKGGWGKVNTVAKKESLEIGRTKTH